MQLRVRAGVPQAALAGVLAPNPPAQCATVVIWAVKPSISAFDLGGRHLKQFAASKLYGHVWKIRAFPIAATVASGLCMLRMVDHLRLGADLL